MGWRQESREEIRGALRQLTSLGHRKPARNSLMRTTDAQMKRVRGVSAEGDEAIVASAMQRGSRL